MNSIIMKNIYCIHKICLDYWKIINLEINLVFLFIYFFLNKPIIGPNFKFAPCIDKYIINSRIFLWYINYISNKKFFNNKK